MQPTLPMPPQPPVAPTDAPEQPPAMQQPVQPPTSPRPEAAQPAPQQSPANALPEIADDGDLIEKEWVAQVKQIVTQTAQSPFDQNKRLTELKAEYMYKRYGKTIKTDE